MRALKAPLARRKSLTFSKLCEPQKQVLLRCEAKNSRKRVGSEIAALRRLEGLLRRPDAFVGELTEKTTQIAGEHQEGNVHVAESGGVG